MKKITNYLSAKSILNNIMTTSHYFKFMSREPDLFLIGTIRDYSTVTGRFQSYLHLKKNVIKP